MYLDYHQSFFLEASEYKFEDLPQYLRIKTLLVTKQHYSKKWY